MNQHEDQAELWMRSFGSQPMEERPLPDPQLIWWQAQSLRRIDRERRALSTLERAERIPLFASLAATIILVACLSIAYLRDEFTVTLLSAIASASGALVVFACWRLSKRLEQECSAQIDRT